MPPRLVWLVLLTVAGLISVLSFPRSRQERIVIRRDVSVVPGPVVARKFDAYERQRQLVRELPGPNAAANISIGEPGLNRKNFFPKISITAGPGPLVISPKG